MKPNNNRELRYIFTVIFSSIVLAVIFATVWVIKKVKEGAII